MKRIRLLPLLAAMLLTSGCATTLSEAEPAKDVVCFQSAKISLTDAILAAEHTGGRAVAARYKQDEELGCLVNKPGEYDVTLLDRGALRTVAVDPRTSAVGAPKEGKTVLERTSHFLDRLFEHDPVESAALVPAAMPGLVESIAFAERSGGKAIKAHVDGREGKLGIVVKLVEDGKTRTTWVDSGVPANLATNESAN